MNNQSNLKLKISLMLVTFLGMFVAMFMRPAIPQVLSYHGFADEALILGVPHFFDVVSNAIFLVVGFLGIKMVLQQKNIMGRRAWLAFFVSIFLIGPGSAYYHWNPNNQTLVWDRLPMGAGFMALYVVLLVEHLGAALEKYLIPFLIVGITSVMVWAIWDDLRFYFWVQFSSFICIPIILLSFKSHYTLKSGYFYCLLFYFLAKLTETFDKQIFFMTSQVVSGHTLKHLLAGVGLWCLVWMIQKREVAKSSLSAAVA